MAEVGACEEIPTEPELGESADIEKHPNYQLKSRAVIQVLLEFKRL